MKFQANLGAIAIGLLLYSSSSFAVIPLELEQRIAAASSAELTNIESQLNNLVKQYRLTSTDYLKIRDTLIPARRKVLAAAPPPPAPIPPAPPSPAPAPIPPAPPPPAPPAPADPEAATRDIMDQIQKTAAQIKQTYQPIKNQLAPATTQKMQQTVNAVAAITQ